MSSACSQKSEKEPVHSSFVFATNQIWLQALPCGVRSTNVVADIDAEPGEALRSRKSIPSSFATSKL
jgi:hypothetical protein